MAWYKFTPPGIGIPDPSDHNQYTLVGSTPPSCPGGCKICAIQSTDNMGYPNMTIALYREIIKALQNCAPSINVLLCT